MTDLFANSDTVLKEPTVMIAGPRWVTSYGVVKVFMDKLFGGLENNLTSEEKRNYKSRMRIISGGATGIDASAEKYAKEIGVKFKEYPAKWADLDDPRGVTMGYRKGKPYNKLAGMHRNRDMVQAASVAIVYWDGVSKGSKNSHDLCTTKMQKSVGDFLYIPVRILDEESLSTVTLLYRECIRAYAISPADREAWYSEFNTVHKVQIWDRLTLDERPRFGELLRCRA
jgi:hypothetical protein